MFSTLPISSLTIDLVYKTTEKCRLIGMMISLLKER